MADRAPIPLPIDDDPEDVFWALSTATTLFRRGEHAEALKWLRRAAEQASDQGADARALVLMKAAAELTATLGAPPPRPSTPPPLPNRGSVPAPPPVPAATSIASIPRPPPLPSRPPAPSIPAAQAPAPRVPSAPVRPPAPAPSKPAGNTKRERSGTLSGRRGASGKRTPSFVDAPKPARSPSVPDDIPDVPIDDLDEVTSVIEHKRSAGPASSGKSAARKPVIIHDADTTDLAPSKPSAAAKPAVASKPILAPSKPTLPSKPAVATKPSVPAKPQITAPTKPEPAAKPEPVAKAEPAAKPEPAAKVEPPAPVVARPVMVRKGTMQVVDEGFESMLHEGDGAVHVPTIAIEAGRSPTPSTSTTLPTPIEPPRASPSAEAPPAHIPSPVLVPVASATPPAPRAALAFASAIADAPAPAASAPPVLAMPAPPPTTPTVTAAPASPAPNDPSSIAIDSPTASEESAAGALKSDSIARPSTAIDAHPSPASTSALLAQRVAVVAAPDGSARLVALEDLASLPEGAVAAIVVPLAGADGERLARLLASRR
ncbi:Hypothetical protein A7982_06642 [Minicystis rosea]|nr:Hypothetical protein A7982_06642 [Minicystis rosea]